MDFELTDWTVDSKVLKLDKQLFSGKNQLTVPEIQQKVKKNGKRKKHEEIDKPTTKKVKKESETITQEEKSIRELKRDKRREKIKKLKAKKLKKSGLSSQELIVKNEDDSCNIENGERKAKDNKSGLDLLAKSNIDKNRKVESKKTEVEHALVDSDSGNVDKKKSKKKKKSSSKRNKYKHLDEARKGLCTSDVNFSVDQNTSIKDKKSCQKKDSSADGEMVAETKKKRKTKQKSTEIESHNEGSEMDPNNDFQTFKSRVERKSVSSIEKGSKQLNTSKLRRILDDKEGTKLRRILDDKEGRKGTDQVQSSDRKMKSKPASLRDKMVEQLKSARFRYINEQLYTQTGSEALSLFKDDKEAFQCYHEGFQNQVEKWPTNPVDIIINQIKAGSVTSVIGDFGCGDAKIARSVKNKVHSFDLVALNDHVVVCNIEKVPLQDNSLDVGVFCLSLMGTNLVEYLMEAYRVIKTGGILIIAEVTSRIQKIGKFIRNIEGLGFEVLKKDTSNSMFILATFKKKGRSNAKVADIQLEPCFYKRR